MHIPTRIPPFREWFGRIRREDRMKQAVTRREFLARMSKVAGASLLDRSEEHTSELQSLRHLVCRLLLEKKKARSPRRRSRPQMRAASRARATTWVAGSGSISGPTRTAPRPDQPRSPAPRAARADHRPG